MATNDFSLKAVLSAVDNISPTLKNVQRNMRTLDRSFKDVTEKAGALALKISAPVMALAGASGMTLKNAVSDFVALGTSIDAAAKRAGIGVEALQKLRLAAELGGSSAEKMDDALSELGIKMGEALAGKNEEALSLFRQMGIALTDSTGRARSAAVVMRELSEAMRINQDNADRLRVLNVLLGGDTAKQLLPVLADGADGLDRMAARAEELGIVLSQADVDASVKLSERFTLFGRVVDSVTTKIGAGISPTLIKLTDQVQAAVIANKDLIATQVNRFLEAVSESVSKIDFGKVIDGFFSFARMVADAIESVGGFKTILMVVGGILAGKLLVDIAGVVTAVAGLGKALYALTGPWGVILAAAAGLFAWLYEHVEGFRTVVDGIKATLVEGFGGKWMENIRAAWDGLKNYITWIFDRITAAIPDWMKDFFCGSVTVNAPAANAKALDPIRPEVASMRGDMSIRVTAENGALARVDGMSGENMNLSAQTIDAYSFAGTD